MTTTLATLTVGQKFTFPRGVEGAGIVHQVVELRGPRILVAVLLPNFAITPMQNIEGTEIVVKL